MMNKQQIITFYKYFTTNQRENKEEKKRLYDELKILPWYGKVVNHCRNIQASKRKAKQTLTANRNVDRLNTTN